MKSDWQNENCFPQHANLNWQPGAGGSNWKKVISETLILTKWKTKKKKNSSFFLSWPFTSLGVYGDGAFGEGKNQSKSRYQLRYVHEGSHFCGKKANRTRNDVFWIIYTKFNRNIKNSFNWLKINVLFIYEKLGFGLLSISINNWGHNDCFHERFLSSCLFLFK
jgi:hypothetical protein